VEFVAADGSKLEIEGVGDWSTGDHKHNGKGAVPIISRQQFKGYVPGDPAPVTGSFSGWVEVSKLTDSANATFYDAILKKGKYAAVGTTNTGSPDVWTTTIRYTLSSGATTTTIECRQALTTATATEQGDYYVITCSFESYDVVMS
jgi:hypothetical protein